MSKRLVRSLNGYIFSSWQSRAARATLHGPAATMIIHFTYSTPRDVDAPRDFLIFYFLIFIFSPNEQRAGGGGGGVRCQTFYFYFFPCSADHERDWPPCIVVFSGLATNALNVRNNKRSRCIQIFLQTTTTTLLTHPNKLLLLLLSSH